MLCKHDIPLKLYFRGVTSVKILCLEQNLLYEAAFHVT